MTYREAIQKLEADTNTLYEKVGGLRDAATLEEKETWNALRGLFDKSWSLLRKLDNSLSEQRAADKVRGTY
jgi:hypothetical protein